MTPVQFIQHHTYTALVVLWLLSNMVAALPAPSATSSPLYKWFFAVSHATFGIAPRLIATMFPSVANLLGISTLQSPESRVAAHAAIVEAEMNKPELEPKQP